MNTPELTPSQNIESAQDVQQPLRNNELGSCLVDFGGTLAVIGFGLAYLLFKLHSFIGVAPGVFFSLLSAFGTFLFLLGKCLDTKAASSITNLCESVEQSAETIAPFVLYLRGFAEDRRSFWNLRGSIQDGSLKTEEEELTDALSPLGTVVAVGKPKELFQPPGAHRIYIPNRLWKDEVCNLISSAQVVVVRIGVSSGLSWEIEQIRGMIEPHQLLLFCSGIRRRRYLKFSQAFHSHFPTKLPRNIRSGDFVWFKNDWTAVRSTRPRLSLHVAMLGKDGHQTSLLRQALIPYYRLHGINQPPVVASLTDWLRFSALAAFVICAVIYSVWMILSYLRTT